MWYYICIRVVTLTPDIWGYTMTVREFDTVTTGTVDYTIFDLHQEHKCVAIFTRDVLQETEDYRRNLVKFDKYENARIIHVFSMNDIIRVSAEID